MAAQSNNTLGSSEDQKLAYVVHLDDRSANAPAGDKAGRLHPALAGMIAICPALPLVRDEEAVPAACPIGRSRPGNYGHSRTARYTGSPADGQVDPLRKPTF